MAISYTWHIKTVNTYPSHTDQQEPSNTESDVIYKINWKLTGEDDANDDVFGNPQQGLQYGSTELDVSDLSSFTAFDSLTTSNVQEWLESTLGEDTITFLKSNIDAQIAEKVTPTTETKTIGS